MKASASESPERLSLLWSWKLLRAPACQPFKVNPHPGLPIGEQGTKGRAELFSTSFRDYERKVREQMDEMFSQTGFNARRDIAGIILNRWGHAFVTPQPGFFFGLDGKPAPRDVLRNAPFGRIAFSHTDLAGAQDHRNAALESHRAVGQLLDRVLT